MVLREIRDLTRDRFNCKARAVAARAISIIGVVGCLLVHTTAHATPIGDFSWNEHTQVECDAGLCGAFFSVANFSDDPIFSFGLLGDSFFDVFVNLQIEGVTQSLSLGDIAPANSSQSFEDLFGVTIASAGLTLTFGIPGLPGFIQLLDQDGNIVTALTAPGSLLIDYAADTVAQVPEPSVMLLFASGLVGLALARRARRRDKLPGEQG